MAQDAHPFNLTALRAIRNPHRLAKLGGLHLLGFGLMLAALSLPTPSKMFSVNPKHIGSYCPRVEGKLVCPLCGDGHPDTWHYAGLCKATEEGRAVCMARVVNLLHNHRDPSSFQRMCAPLVDWLWKATMGEERPDETSGLIALGNCIMDEGPLGVRYLVGPYLPPQPSEAPASLAWAEGRDWPFLLHRADQWPGPLGARRRLILLWPEGCFPSLRTSEEGNVEWSPYPVALSYLGEGTPPPVRRGMAIRLAEILANFCREGATGMSLFWPGEIPLPLDTLPHPLQTEILGRWRLLPTPLAGAPLPESHCSLAMSWLGLLPSIVGNDVVQEELARMGAEARDALLEKVAVTILSCQFRTWRNTRALIKQALRAHKKAARSPGTSAWNGNSRSSRGRAWVWDLGGCLRPGEGKVWRGVVTIGRFFPRERRLLPFRVGL